MYFKVFCAVNKHYISKDHTFPRPSAAFMNVANIKLFLNYSKHLTLYNDKELF